MYPANSIRGGGEITVERIGDERTELPAYKTLPVMRPNGEIAFAVLRQIPEEEYRKHYAISVPIVEGTAVDMALPAVYKSLPVFRFIDNFFHEKFSFTFIMLLYMQINCYYNI